MLRFRKILVILLVCIVIHPVFASNPDLITNGSRKEKKIALTFDACPAHDARVDWEIINILVQTKTKATLFLSGKWMKEFPEATRHLSTFPQFEIANHSYSHPHMTALSEEAIIRELTKTQEIANHLTGITPTLFRPPYGEYDAHVVETAKKAGLQTVEYDLPSGDPDPTFSKEKLIRTVTHQAQNGSIIVMHMNGRGWHTAEALPEIIANFKQRGFELVTVSELVGESNPSGQHLGYWDFLKHLLEPISNKGIL